MHEYKLKFAAALSGFLIFMGIIMIGVFTIVYLGFADVRTLETQEYRILSLMVLLMVGVLDLLSGILLRHK